MMKNSHKTNKFHVRKGDTVLILSGNSKGKKGKVLEVYKDSYRAIVEGANFVTKHHKPSASDPNGRIEQQEAPIHLSNLQVVDPSSGDATRVGRKRDDNGKLFRYSKKTGEEIKNG